MEKLEIEDKNKSSRQQHYRDTEEGAGIREELLAPYQRGGDNLA